MDDRGRDGETNFILRIKEQETRLILHKHDDDGGGDDDLYKNIIIQFPYIRVICNFFVIHTD